MGKQKLFRVQAMNENGMIMDVEVMGRKAHDIAMKEALGMCQAQGKGLVRSQMEHARGWAVYVYDAAKDARYARQVYKDEAAAHSARFDRWKACGGAGWTYGATPVAVFHARGYTFWRDATGHYGVAPSGHPAPSHCGYADVHALARLKGVTLP